MFFYSAMVKAPSAGICHEGPFLSQHPSFRRSYPDQCHTVRDRDFLDSPAHKRSYQKGAAITSIPHRMQLISSGWHGEKDTFRVPGPPQDGITGTSTEQETHAKAD